VAMREGNNILGVYACDPNSSPLAIRYLVDLSAPAAEITLSGNGNKYTVCNRFHIDRLFSFRVGMAYCVGKWEIKYC